MNSDYYRLALVAGALLALLPVFAHTDPTPVLKEEAEVTVIVGEQEQALSVQEAFLENAPVNPNDVGMPRFAIAGKDNKFYLGIGLQFLGEAVFDWGDTMPSAVNMVPNEIERRTPGNGSSLRFAASNSSIYLSCVALPQSENKIGLFFAGKFDDDYRFGMDHLYVRYRGLTVGYTYSAFADGGAMPATIDDNGPDGIVNYKDIVAYWTQKFGAGWSGAAGIDVPSRDMTYSPTTTEVAQRAPAFPLYVQYAWNEASHLRASALIRPMQYRDAASGRNRTPCGWGVQLSGCAGIAGGLSALFSGSYGTGIGQYLAGDNGLGYDAVPDVRNPGKLGLMKTMGVMGSLVYEFSDHWCTHVTYSHLSNWLPSGGSVGTDASRYGDYLAANIIYTVNRLVEIGLEYDYAKKKTWGGDSLHTNRLQCQLAVTF